MRMLNVRYTQPFVRAVGIQKLSTETKVIKSERPRMTTIFLICFNNFDLLLANDKIHDF